MNLREAARGIDIGADGRAQGWRRRATSNCAAARRAAKGKPAGQLESVANLSQGSRYRQRATAPGVSIAFVGDMSSWVMLHS